jgi:hypothetical protein
MTDRADVSTWRKLIGIALLSPLFVLQVSVLAQDIDSANAAADPLRLAAEDTASCQELRDPDVRLACFDAAADRLAEALSSMDQVERNAGDLPIGPGATDASASQAAPTAVAPSVRATEQLPDWAAAPEPEPEQRDNEKAEIPRRFEATIVRITSNNVGRHRFYTQDGAVWEQTQLVEVIQPTSLPAVAEFRRRLTGNPTISFEVSSRSYRVRRIE